MKLAFTKTDTAADLTITRSDGSADSWLTTMACGIPHDLIHWIVEDHFDLKHAFYGQIAAGMDQYAVNELAEPESELAKTEKLVLLIQTDHDIRAGKLNASSSHLRGLYGLRYPSFCADSDVDQICEKISSQSQRWAALHAGETLEFEFFEGGETSGS